MKPLPEMDKLTAIVADTRDASDSRWIQPIGRADAVVHLAAVNPAPDSTWAEGVMAFDMTANLVLHAARHKCRFIFASSNDAMGGYKDTPPPGGRIDGATPALTGTRFFDGTGYKTSSAYGSTKILGERLLIAAALAWDGRLTGVNTRIGWVQRGENRAATLGSHGAERKGELMPDPAEAARDLTWFRNMWFSNRDFLSLMEKAIRADASGWPSPVITVAGVSNNKGTLWDRDRPQISGAHAGGRRVGRTVRGLSADGQFEVHQGADRAVGQ